MEDKSGLIRIVCTLYDILTIWLPLLTLIFAWLLIANSFGSGQSMQEPLISKLDERALFFVFFYPIILLYRGILWRSGQHQQENSHPLDKEVHHD